jgi:3-deoxy-D-manno-octulosonate 8-phosphate phosphatase (KDO 8-P phosphatase)
MTNQSLSWHKIKCLILDIDGVCTTGQLHYSEHGESIKTFNVLDGQGIRNLLQNNKHVAIISGRNSKIVTARFRPLGVKHIYQNQSDKTPAYLDILKKLNITDQQIAYIGDDTPDLPLITRSQIGITVPNGHPSAKLAANFICQNHGGNGAVREICDLILAAKEENTP